MSLLNAIVKTGASAFTPTGGSDLTFSALVQEGKKVILQVIADTDYRLRRKITCTALDPRVDSAAPNGMSQVRTKAKFTKPKLLANGKVTTNSVEVIVARDWETTEAEVQELLDVGAQCLVDTDFVSFHKYQSMG